MWLSLQKWLTALLMPVPVSINLLLLAAILLYVGKRAAATALFLSALVWLYLASTPWLAAYLLHSLETDYPPFTGCNTSLANETAIVVLGGNATARTAHAALLYRSGCARHVIVAAGGINLSRYEQSEAAQMVKRLKTLGVPDSAIKAEWQSRTTLENAEYAIPLLQHTAVTRILLVTSAWHMRRAEGIFARSNFHIVPAATDYLGDPCPADLALCWAPAKRAISKTGLTIKEYAGHWIQVDLGEIW